MEIEQFQIGLDEVPVVEAKPFVVVGIPAFNEEATIAKVVSKAQKYADVVVVCDDGSVDMTATIAECLGADVVRHRRNLGYGATIKSLFKRARELNADALVTIDADGQHDPEEIPDLLKPIVRDISDLVIGCRFIKTKGTEEMPLYRQLGAKLITKLVNGSSKNGIRDAQSGFRAYSRQALEWLTPFESGMGASVEILLKANKHGLKIHEVPSACKYNNGNIATSTEHPITHGLSVIISLIRFIIAERPPTILRIPGLLFLLFGLGFEVWMLQMFLVDQQIVTSILFVSMTFVLIGILTIFAARILYAVSKQTRKMIVANEVKSKV